MRDINNPTDKYYADGWLMGYDTEYFNMPWVDYDKEHGIERKKSRPYCPPFKPGEVEQLVAEYFERGGKITKCPTRKSK